MVAGKCGCDKGYFPDGENCTKCDNDCLECHGINKCDQCQDGYINFHGICKKTGPLLWRYAASIAGVLLLADISTFVVIFSFPVPEVIVICFYRN